MAQKVSIADVRNHLTKLVRDVERGKRIDLTRRGKRVAVLVSSEEYDRLRAPRPPLPEALRAWRRKLPPDFEGLGEDEVRAWRDSAVGRDVELA